jgi:multicomponent Na+:H+ antiporter subunit B
MSRRTRIAIASVALAGFAVLLLSAYTGLPDFGHYRGPYGYVLNRISLPRRHMANVVNATTYDIRGFDTMGEEFILFAAVVGVVLLLRDEKDESVDDAVRNDLLRQTGSLAAALVVLVGLWIVAFGFITPGGGFQGGVILSGSLLMLFVAVGYRSWRKVGTESALDPFEGIGAGGFVVVGLAALASGLPFLTNFWGPGIPGTLWSGGSAPLVNWAAGIEVAAALLVLYTEFLEAHVVPMIQGRRA